MSIENFLLQRYPGSGRQQKVREEIASACNAFVKSGLSDAEVIKELCSGSEQKYWSCISEALLAARLCNAGLNPAPSHGGGPDFLLIEKKRKIWIEVICPEPKGVPLDWLNPELGKVIDFPHE